MATNRSGDRRLRVTLKRSLIGRLRRHQASVMGLGLRRRNQSRIVEDSQSIRGMIQQVAYLVECEEL